MNGWRYLCSELKHALLYQIEATEPHEAKRREALYQQLKLADEFIKVAADFINSTVKDYD